MSLKIILRKFNSLFVIVTQKIAKRKKTIRDKREYLYLKKSIQSTKDIYNEVSKELDSETQFLKLKKIIFLFVVRENDTKLYNEILSLYIPEWSFFNNNLEIIQQKGVVRTNLNIYRKLNINNQVLFEKTYYSKAPTLQRMVWFQINIYPFIVDNIEAPDLYEIFEGDLLTVAYTEFKDFIKIDSFEKEEDSLIEITKLLYISSIDERVERIIESVNLDILNYKYQFFYLNYHENINEYLELHEVDVKRLEKTISIIRKVIVHGDLNRHNVSQTKIVIDWDALGVYPAAWEPSFIYNKLYLRNNHENLSPINWLNKHFKDIVKNDEWKDYELSFVYFLLINGYTSFFKKEMYFNLRDELVDYLKKRFPIIT